MGNTERDVTVGKVFRKNPAGKVFRKNLDSPRDGDNGGRFTGKWDEEKRWILTDPATLPEDLSVGDYLSFETDDFPNVGQVVDHGTIEGGRAFVEVEFLRSVD